MTDDTHLDKTIRQQILADPDLILADPEIMQALVEASGVSGNTKVIDIRNIAMKRLEDRFARLDSQHRTVIATAYDNLVGVTQVQNALLCLLDARSPADFQQMLARDVTEILRVDSVQIVQETSVGNQRDAASSSPANANDIPADREKQAGNDRSAVHPGTMPVAVPTGFIDHYLTNGSAIPPRDILLRAVSNDTLAAERTLIFGSRAAGLASEACMRLSLGRAACPALLVLGATDQNQFDPQQGTDLLSFFGEAVARILRRLAV